MGQMYWLLEYGKVLLGYGFVMYIWPLVVFAPHLKGKSRSYRFSFCMLSSVMIANTGVLVLGFFKLLYPLLVAVLYFGTFFLRLFQDHHPQPGWTWDFQCFLAGAMTIQRLLLRIVTMIRDGIRGAISAWWETTKRRRLEFFLLFFLVAFGMIYFSYGAFDEHSYGFGDQYVHHSWIYGLQNGKIFYEGIYPEAMHCVIYMVCTLFRIRLYSGVLFFAGIHISAFLVSAYLLMRELFHWKYTPLLVLAAFLIVDQTCIDMVYGMSRLTWTLPLEFGLFTEFLCGKYLIRFLKRIKRGERVLIRWRSPKEWRKLFQDEDLFLFMLAVAASLAIHFYVTIIAFFLCVSVVLIYLRQIFYKGSFAPLAVSAVLALILAVTPMGMAFAAGYPLQGSIGWAMEIMSGSESEGQETRPSSEATPSQEPSEASQSPIVSTSPSTPAVSPGQSTGQSAGAPASEIPIQESKGLTTRVKEKVLGLAESLWNRAKLYARYLYDYCYNTLYPGFRGKLLVGLTVFGFLSANLLRFLFWCLRRIQKQRETKRRLRTIAAWAAKEAGEDYAEEDLTPVTGKGVEADYTYGYLIVVFLAVTFLVMYTPAPFGLPSLVAGSRMCSSVHLAMLMLYGIPVDYFFCLVGLVLPDLSLQAASYLLCAGLYIFVQMNGIYHGYLYYELTRYNAAVEITNRIIKEYPDQSFTIISTTDEFYQLIGHGFHEELLTFLQRWRDPTYTIPSQYIFLYVEKHPIHYAQNHFSGGPLWLAAEKYPAMYEHLHTESQCPNIRAGQISLELAREDIRYGQKLSDSASDLTGRTILESKAYLWYQTFSEMYPHDGQVIYEDDDFLCYCLDQEVNSLFTLGIFYGTE